MPDDEHYPVKRPGLRPKDDDAPLEAGEAGHAKAKSEDKYIIRAAMKTLEALDLFNVKNSSICVTELQQALGINSNMAFRILYTLEKAKYIVLNPETNKYHLSLKVFAMGKVAASSISITKVAAPYMQLLSAEYRKPNIALLVYEQGDLILADRISSSWLPQIHAHVGRIIPLHASAGGKALLSELPEEELERVVGEKGMESFTAHTITDLPTLKKELAQIRATHLAWEREEHVLDFNGVGSLIRDKNGKAIAALCLTGFTSYLSLQELEQMTGKLLETIFRISDTVRYMKA